MLYFNLFFGRTLFFGFDSIIFFSRVGNNHNFQSHNSDKLESLETKL